MYPFQYFKTLVLLERVKCFYISRMSTLAQQVEKLEKEKQYLERELQIKDAIIKHMKELIQALDYDDSDVKEKPKPNPVPPPKIKGFEKPKNHW